MGDEGVNLERENEGEVCSRSGGIVMDTPERKQISTSVSKFEDSPVFNYLNNLSPIQPVKSVHITQSFNSLSFASLPSVFTSPHVSSLKESRFLRRHQLSDPSKPEFSSENGNKVGRNEEVRDTEQYQNFDPGSSAGEVSAEPPYKSSIAIELSRTMCYEFVNPDCDPTMRCGTETKCIPGLTGSSTPLVPCFQSDSAKGSFGSEVHIGGTSQIDENKEAAGCDWENLLSNETNLLIFDSPCDSKSLKDPNQKSLEPGTSFCSYLTDDLQDTGAVEAIGLSQLYLTDNTSSQHEDGGDMKEIAEDQDILISLSNCMEGDTSEKVDDELASNLHRGMRRRCLVFEIVGSRKKHLDDSSHCGPSMLAQSHDNIASGDKRVAPIKPGHDTPRCILPGIGLHLNALAATSVDQKVVKHEALATRGQPISVSHSAAYLNSSNSEDITNNSLVVTASERDMLPAEGGVPIVEDAAQASGYMINEAFNHSSPKKKRRRLENGGESEACKRCNCKKSKCLKLYCECFAAGVYCVEPCSCQECFNKPIHEDTVLATRKQIESRNPLAFAPKVIRSSDFITEIVEESSKTPASARHKRGCNCKKSGCLKKYCECYQGGVGCSINCRCEGCKNAFGRKDGTEVELEEEQEVDECERSVIDRSLQRTTIQNDAEEQNTTFALPATPLRFVGHSTRQPFFSKSNKPPRSSFLAIGSSSGLYGNQRLGRLNPPQAKFEKHIQTARGDEMPEILQRNDSPISGVKSASPNSKRVSPPHCNSGSPPGQRSSRKLILQSIPSFPSLNP